MLQQTRAETVIPYYDRFLRELPTVTALAEATPDRVMSLWSGLGYYRRARMLHQAAQDIARTRAGSFPDTAVGLREVRGIGRYTAGAIASIAYGEQAALVDGNVARVLARIFAIDADVKRGPGLARIWELAEALVPAQRAGDWNQALMELGATTCTPRAPRCPDCPVRDSCEARARGLEGVLPVLAARVKPSPSLMFALVATVGRKVLLVRRRPSGLFGGLWEPPLLPRRSTRARTGLAAASRAFSALLGVEVPPLVLAGSVTHTLSHRRIVAWVSSIQLPRVPASLCEDGSSYDALELVSPAAFARLGMSTLARKILAVAGVGRPEEAANR